MNIYLLKNFSLKEIYFGMTAGHTRDAVASHRNNPDSPVGHWRFDSEEIKWGLVGEEMPEVYAPGYLQALRREPPEDGWIIVVGME